ncbi:MAG: hypothetical protein ACYCZ6_12235 [Polaromonas sp.]
MIGSSIDSHPSASAVDIDRNAYNAAFYELGLKWHWDTETYQALLSNAGEKDRVRIYLETHQPHLLKAYEADFLVEAIQTTKERCYDNMAHCCSKNAGAINWAEIQGVQVGA